MASNEEPSQVPSPPESPHSGGQAACVADDPGSQAVENQPHMAPQVVEMEQNDMYDDASTDDDDDIEPVQDGAYTSHRPPGLGYQQTPIHAGSYPPFSNWAGYESPPPSEVGSQRTSQRQGTQQRNAYRRGQPQQQRERSSEQPVGAFNSNHHAFEAPSNSRQRRPNKKTFPSGQHGTSWNTPYTNYVDNDMAGVPLSSPAQGRRARHGMPTHEHPVQVPVRVVNPGNLAPSKPDTKEKASLRIKLDLNLDVEITLKASLRGDLTLALL